MEGLALDNWEKGPWFNIHTGEEKVVSGGKTLSCMEKASGSYLNRDHVETLDGVKEYQPPKIVLQQIAERLVRHRRLREETKNDNLKRWQTYMGQWLTGDLKDEDSAIHVSPPTTRKSSRLKSLPISRPVSRPVTPGRI
jgi:hypothetical protein